MSKNQVAPEGGLPRRRVRFFTFLPDLFRRPPVVARVADADHADRDDGGDRVGLDPLQSRQRHQRQVMRILVEEARNTRSQLQSTNDDLANNAANFIANLVSNGSLNFAQLSQLPHLKGEDAKIFALKFLEKVDQKLFDYDALEKLYDFVQDCSLQDQEVVMKEFLKKAEAHLAEQGEEGFETVKSIANFLKAKKISARDFAAKSLCRILTKDNGFVLFCEDAEKKKKVTEFFDFFKKLPSAGDQGSGYLDFFIRAISINPEILQRNGMENFLHYIRLGFSATFDALAQEYDSGYLKEHFEAACKLFSDIDRERFDKLEIQSRNVQVNWGYLRDFYRPLFFHFAPQFVQNPKMVANFVAPSVRRKMESESRFISKYVGNYFWGESGNIEKYLKDEGDNFKNLYRNFLKIDAALKLFNVEDSTRDSFVKKFTGALIEAEKKGKARHAEFLDESDFETLDFLIHGSGDAYEILLQDFLSNGENISEGCFAKICYRLAKQGSLQQNYQEIINGFLEKTPSYAAIALRAVVFGLEEAEDFALEDSRLKFAKGLLQKIKPIDINTFIDFLGARTQPRHSMSYKTFLVRFIASLAGKDLELERYDSKDFSLNIAESDFRNSELMGEAFKMASPAQIFKFFTEFCATCSEEGVKGGGLNPKKLFSDYLRVRDSGHEYQEFNDFIAQMNDLPIDQRAEIAADFVMRGESESATDAVYKAIDRVVKSGAQEMSKTQYCQRFLRVAYYFSKRQDLVDNFFDKIGDFYNEEGFEAICKFEKEMHEKYRADYDLKKTTSLVKGFFAKMPREFFGTSGFDEVIKRANDFCDSNPSYSETILNAFLDEAGEQILTEKAFLKLFNFYRDRFDSYEIIILNIERIISRFSRNFDAICTSSVILALLEMRQGRNLSEIDGFLKKAAAKIPEAFLSRQCFNFSPQFESLRAVIIEGVAAKNTIELDEYAQKNLWQFCVRYFKASGSLITNRAYIVSRVQTISRVAEKLSSPDLSLEIDQFSNNKIATSVAACLQMSRGGISESEFDEIEKRCSGDYFLCNTELRFAVLKIMENPRGRAEVVDFVQRFVFADLPDSLQSSESVRNLKTFLGNFLSREEFPREIVADFYSSIIAYSGQDGGQQIARAQFLLNVARHEARECHDESLEKILADIEKIKPQEEVVDAWIGDIEQLRDDIDIAVVENHRYVNRVGDGVAVWLGDMQESVGKHIYSDDEKILRDFVTIFPEQFPWRENLLPTLENIRAKNAILRSYRESQREAEAEIFALALEKKTKSFAEIYEKTPFAVSALAKFLRQNLDGNFEQLTDILYDFRTRSNLVSIVTKIFKDVGAEAISLPRINSLFDLIPKDSKQLRRDFVKFLIEKNFVTRLQALEMIKRSKLEVDLVLDYEGKTQDLFSDAAKIEIAMRLDLLGDIDEINRFSFQELYCFFEMIDEDGWLVEKVREEKIRGNFCFGAKIPVLSQQQTKVLIRLRPAANYPTIFALGESLRPFMQEIPPLSQKAIASSAIKFPEGYISSLEHDANALSLQFQKLLSPTDKEPNLATSKKIADFFCEITSMSNAQLADQTKRDIALVFLTNKDRFQFLLCQKEGGFEAFCQKIFNKATIGAGCHANFGTVFSLALNELLIDNKAAEMVYSFYSGAVFPFFNSSNEFLDHSKEYDVFRPGQYHPERNPPTGFDPELNPVGFVACFKNSVPKQKLQAFCYPAFYKILTGEDFKEEALPDGLSRKDLVKKEEETMRELSKKIEDFVQKLATESEDYELVEDCENYMTQLVLQRIGFERVMNHGDVKAAKESADKFEGKLKELREKGPKEIWQEFFELNIAPSMASTSSSAAALAGAAVVDVPVQPQQ